MNDHTEAPSFERQTIGALGLQNGDAHPQSVAEPDLAAISSALCMSSPETTSPSGAQMWSPVTPSITSTESRYCP